MKVLCYDIKYKGKEAIISITGPEALANFSEKGYINYYSAETAPVELAIDVILPKDWLNNIVDADRAVKEVLESETGLKVDKCSWRIIG